MATTKPSHPLPSKTSSFPRRRKLTENEVRIFVSKNYVSVPLALIDKKRRTSFPLMARMFQYVSPKSKKNFFSHHIQETFVPDKVHLFTTS
mmetsp:Transcript_2881/g.3274  ORF Transcript_2881/g.3274 Transcript_2881/m.3274 type:complete len:91 (-) Transcript_2881:302-574(-)